LPEDASIGLTPQRAAKDASLFCLGGLRETPSAPPTRSPRPETGNLSRARFPEPGTENKYPKWLVAKPDGDRVAVFAALGLDDAHHDRHIEYLKTRTYIINAVRNSIYDDEALAEADKIGLKVRDLRREIEGDDSVGQNEKWMAIPY
jgi:hypothetical protein